MKKIILPLCCLLLLLTGCDPTTVNAPESITIDGVTYRTGFYGDLSPLFVQTHQAGTKLLQDESVYADDDKERKYTFRRVAHEEHDWIWLTGRHVLYCAEDKWEQEQKNYANPQNFIYQLLLNAKYLY